MKKRNIIYISISIVCVLAIAIAVYYQFFVANQEEQYGHQTGQNNTNTTVEKTLAEENEEVKEEFTALFTNAINFQRNTVTGVEKLDDSKEIVYTAFAIKEEQEDKYSVNINIPYININTEVAMEFNQTTQKIFADKASDVINNSDEYTIYNIDYIAFINGEVLSVAIRSTLKEGNSAQRVIVQTYNYSLTTSQSVSLNDALDYKGVTDLESVNTKIADRVKAAAEQATALSEATGQVIYKRDLNNAIYLTNNANTYLYGKDGVIYIIYAYGNSYRTSEMDVIKIE